MSRPLEVQFYSSYSFSCTQSPQTHCFKKVYFVGIILLFWHWFLFEVNRCLIMIFIQQQGQGILSKIFGLLHVSPLFIHSSNAENCEKIEIWIWDKRDVCFHAIISLSKLLKQSLILKPCTPRTFLQQIKITHLLCAW